MRQATLGLNLGIKKTPKSQFLEQMDWVVPSIALVELIHLVQEHFARGFSSR